MSMIENQISEMRHLVKRYNEPPFGREIDGTVEILERAISTIQDLSAKLAAVNMERSSAYYNGGWIPVEDTLPENAKDKGALCPRYLVTTKRGVTEGWYNPDVKSWYVLFWFMTTDYEEYNIDFDRGTYPKIIRVPDGGKVKITAWCRLPEPYRKEV